MSEVRGLHVGFAAAAAVALVGLVSGVESSGREVASYVGAGATPTSASTTSSDTFSYRDLRVRPRGANAALATGWWHGLRAGAAAPLGPLAAASPEERLRALTRRQSRRAFDGAPPTIPHAFDQLGVPACLACHGDGLLIGGKIAPRMSHLERTSCLQCHVGGDETEGARTRTSVDRASVANGFVGLRAPAFGERAWADAPPTIPHTTWMRERCDSCHGPRGVHGLKTPHPWRMACTQCHAPSAVLDQRPPRSSGRAP